MEHSWSLAGLQAQPFRVFDIVWSPEGDRFAVLGEDSSVIAIYAAGGGKIRDVKTPSGWLWAGAWSKDYLAVSNNINQKIYVYDSQTYGNVAEVYTEYPTGELDFSPDGKLMVGCLRADGTLHIWDTSNWIELKSWPAHPAQGTAQGCISGAFSKDGSVYFTGGDDGNLIAWDVNAGDRLKTFEFGQMVWSISLSGDGKLLAAGLDNGQAKIIGLK
jgi:WD40 repeat protein